MIDGFDYRTAFSAVAVMLGIGAVVYSLWDRWLVSERRSWPEQRRSAKKSLSRAEDSPARIPSIRSIRWLSRRSWGML